MTDLEERVSKRFREHRQRRSLSQSQLARSVGCSTELVSRIERARCLPSVKSLIAFAEALGVSPNELLGYQAPAAGSPERGPGIHPAPGGPPIAAVSNADVSA